jgi:hypothetical protein
LALADTHFPKAFRPVPYVPLKAVRSALRSLLHALAARMIALCAAAVALLDFDDTQLPKAAWAFLPPP